MKVSVPNKNGAIKPNLIATIKLNDYTNKNAIVIPQNILQENAQNEYIAYLVNKENDSLGVAQKQVVETGLNYDNKIEITKGLKAGETIIIEGARIIREGQEIKITENEQ